MTAACLRSCFDNLREVCCAPWWLLFTAVSMAIVSTIPRSFWYVGDVILIRSCYNEVCCVLFRYVNTYEKNESISCPNITLKFMRVNDNVVPPKGGCGLNIRNHSVSCRVVTCSFSNCTTVPHVFVGDKYGVAKFSYAFVELELVCINIYSIQNVIR